VRLGTVIGVDLYIIEGKVAGPHLGPCLAVMEIDGYGDVFSLEHRGIVKELTARKRNRLFT
jgi:hypothetical protein